jgi:type IV pilus assembly protein PilM
MASTGTGVVLGSHSVKVVQARKKGGILKLSSVANIKFDNAMAERPMDGPKADRMASLLSGAIGKTGDAMLGLTGRDLIIRYTHVPPVPDWRLAMLMKFEIEEVSEQSGGEVSANWAPMELDDTASADNTVLVALAKNATLFPRISVLKKAGLKLRGACPNSIAFYHAYVNTAKLEPDEVTMLMHIGAENTDIAIQRNGKLLFARNVSGGGRLFTDAIMQQFGSGYERAEKMKFQKADVTPKSSAKYPDSLSEKVSNSVLGVTGQFVSMVHSSVMFCKAQAKLKELSVDKVVLAGGGANLKGFAEYLETNLGIPVVIYDPSAAVDLSGLAPEEAEAFESDPTGLTVALGLAAMSLERSAFNVEILPEEIRKRRHFMESEAWMIGAGGLVALLIVLLFITTGRDHGEANLERGQLDNQQRIWNKEIEEFERAQASLEAADIKWRNLRDRVRVGPTAQLALSMINRVIRGQGIDAVHLLDLRTDTRVEFVPKPGLDLEEDAQPNPETHDQQVIVQVECKAAIQLLGQSPDDVFTGFVNRLRAETVAAGGVTVDSRPPARDNTFNFTLKFAPGN